jgi:hypothetical protein
MKTDAEKKYILCLDYIGIDAREFVTKPMTTAEFNDEFEKSYLAQEFPIVIEGNRTEVSGDNNLEWDRFAFTQAMYDNPNLFVTWGVYNAKKYSR